MNNSNAEFSSMMKQRRFTEAAAFADRQLVMAGGRSQFWLTRLSSALLGSGDSDGALEAARKSCDIAPGNAWALCAQGEALLKKGLAAEALHFFNDARGDSRTAPRACRGAFSCMVRMKAWQDILDALVRWGVPESEAYAWKTRALVALKRTAEAQVECDRWLAASPDNRDALWQQSEIWIVTEGLDAALARMSRLAKIPGKPSVYGELHAALCKRAGKTADAARQYGRLLDRKVTPALQRKQAFALAKSGRESEAIPMLEEMLRKAPADNYLNNGYIGACARSGALERAWIFYHDLLKLFAAEKTLFGRIGHVRKCMESAGIPVPEGETQ
jgi:predicted Zn-dependent protease